MTCDVQFLSPSKNKKPLLFHEVPILKPANNSSTKQIQRKASKKQRGGG